MLRSSRCFTPEGLSGFPHRTAQRSEGLSDIALLEGWISGR